MNTDPRRYQAATLRTALHLYQKTKTRANRAYSPANMMRTASNITGLKFKPRDYQGAIEALDKWLQAL